MSKKGPDNIIGRGGFLDASDPSHTGLVRVRPPRPESLSEADSVAAMAIPDDDGKAIVPLHLKPATQWSKLSRNGSPIRPQAPKQSMTRLGLSKEALAKADPAYLRCLKLGDDWRKQRMKEYIVNHGHVSAGV